MWSDGIAAWYSREGRHGLPWRLTRDPWEVLVSEVMLQQTPVARVLPRWRRFLDRWPDPEACAASPLDDVLREWQGLGYPRRARALWECARVVTERGWPPDEAGLRALPGVGVYTARALLTLAWERPSSAPRDTNLGRVAARAALGVEPDAAPAPTLDAALSEGRPRGFGPRDWTLALFDLGATVCTARTPRCGACPLHGCRSRLRLAEAPPPPRRRRQGAYEGSLRQLRGRVLAAWLAGDRPPDRASLELRLAAAGDLRLDEALRGLRADGLIADGWPAP